MTEKTVNIDILTLNAFINLWLCKTRIEIEQLCVTNETLKTDMLKSQLSAPIEAWHNIQENIKKKVIDIEDCHILGYSWGELKKVIDYARMMGYGASKNNTGKG